MASLIEIEVVYAHLTDCCIIPLQVAPTTTIQQAIEQSGILQFFPSIQLTGELTLNRVGIFGELKKLDEQVKAFDRIEIYNPIKQHPMSARQARIKENPKKGALHG